MTLLRAAAVALAILAHLAAPVAAHLDAPVAARGQAFVQIKGTYPCGGALLPNRLSVLTTLTCAERVMATKKDDKYVDSWVHIPPGEVIRIVDVIPSSRTDGMGVLQLARHAQNEDAVLQIPEDDIGDEDECEIGLVDVAGQTPPTVAKTLAVALDSPDECGIFQSDLEEQLCVKFKAGAPVTSDRDLLKNSEGSPLACSVGTVQGLLVDPKNMEHGPDNIMLVAVFHQAYWIADQMDKAAPVEDEGAVSTESEVAASTEDPVSTEADVTVSTEESVSTGKSVSTSSTGASSTATPQTTSSTAPPTVSTDLPGASTDLPGASTDLPDASTDSPVTPGTHPSAAGGPPRTTLSAAGSVLVLLPVFLVFASLLTHP